MTQEALKALIHEMEYVLSCINAEEIPFDGDSFHEALRLGKEALDYLAKEKEALAQTQEPVTHCEAGPEYCPVCQAETQGEE